jgi:hypothetical protein
MAVASRMWRRNMSRFRVARFWRRGNLPVRHSVQPRVLIGYGARGRDGGYAGAPEQRLGLARFGGSG